MRLLSLQNLSLAIIGLGLFVGVLAERLVGMRRSLSNFKFATSYSFGILSSLTKRDFTELQFECCVWSVPQLRSTWIYLAKRGVVQNFHSFQ